MLAFATSVLQVIVEAADPYPEADAVLLLEPVPDKVLGFLGVVSVVETSHRGDVRLGDRLVVAHVGDLARQTDPVVAVIRIDDGEADPWIATEIGGPAAAVGAVDDQPLAFDQVPDDGLAGAAVRIDGGDRGELGRIDEAQDVIGE